MNQIVSHAIASFFAISLAVVFYINSLKLPPAAYQLPRLLCGIIIFLSVLMLFGAIVEERTVKKNKNGDAEAKLDDKLILIP